MVLIGFNFKLDKFQLILIALLSHEDNDIFTKFYNFLKNTYLFTPNKITFDFSLANIKAIKKVYSEKDDDVTIISCLFHLTQCWFRKASKFNLRKKKYLDMTKCLIFNLELLAFMDFDSA